MATRKPKQPKWPDGTPKSQNNDFDWKSRGPSFLHELGKKGKTSAQSTKNVAERKATTLVYSKASKE